jgi:hypothetical protein
MRPAFIAAGLLFAVHANAQTPAASSSAAPATVTATCKDGTPFSGPSMKGACRGHGGVQKAAAGTTPAAATTSAAATPAATSTTATPPAGTAKGKYQMPATAKPGGGPGLVWVNTDSKAYHCNGTKWYGKTKVGEYMSESAAKAAGYHAASKKACAS